MNAGGGPGIETPIDIVIDSSDNIYLSGITESVDFPLKNAPFTSLDSTYYPAFLTKLSPGGKSILYSTYIPSVPLLATLPGGEIAAVGNSTVPQVNAIPPNAAQLYADVAFEVFDTTKSGMDSLLISSYLGSLAHENPQAASVDAQGNLLIAGITGANPILVNPYQNTCTNCGFPYGIAKGFVTRVQLASGSLTLTPTTQNFPDTPSGSSSPTQTSILTNTTSASISLSAGTLTDANDFSASDNCNGNIASGASCTVTFTFKPQSAGALSATYSIYDVNNPSSPLNVALTGTGVGATSSVPATLDFGSVGVGSSLTGNLVVTNTGTVPVTFTSITISGGGFSYNTGSNIGCFPIAPGANCNIPITFAPTTAGSKTGQAVLVDNAGTHTTALTGTGIAPMATLNPSTADFQSITVGAVSSTQTFALKNTGATSLAITSVSLTGANASSFALSANQCGTLLAAGASCSAGVTFDPTAAGTASAALTVVSSAGTLTAALTGKGVPPVLTVTPSSLDFGSVSIGLTATKTVTITNSSTVRIVPDPDPFSSSGAAFSQSASTCGSYGTLGFLPGETCTLSFTFTPTTAQSSTGYYSIADSAGTQTIGLMGTGITPTVTIVPAALSFGDQQLLTKSAPKTVTVTNTSPVAIALTDTGSIPFANIPNFDLVSDSCTPTLAAGASCSATVAFQGGPVIGVRSSTLNFALATGPLNVPLTGTAILDTSTLTPTSYDFGSTQLGVATAPHTFTFTNTSPVTLTLTDTGTIISSAFSIVSDTCTSTVAAGASCSVVVNFSGGNSDRAPVGAITGSLTIKSLSGAALNATLTGTATPPTLTVTPTALDFGSVTVGTTVTKTITYTNPSEVLRIVPTGLLGPGNGYTLSTGTCGSFLTLGFSPGETCSLDITFAPTAATSYPGSLSFTDVAGTQIVAITGTGIAPTLTITPTNLAFGNVPIGTTVNQTVTFTNTSTLPVTFAGNATPSGDFGTVFTPGLPDTCLSTTIAAGASCAITFSFTPTASGSYSGTLVFADNAGTQTITFGGTGFFDGPMLALDPTTYSFGAISAGASVGKEVILTNVGTKEANFVYGSSTDSSGPSIAVVGNTCQTTLAPGAGCTISLQITGADSGTAHFTIYITGNSGTNSVAASLIGFGANGSPNPTFIDQGNGFTANALTLNGASTLNGGVLQLTANQASQASSAFYPTQITTTSFSTDFAFQLLDPLAEGITFTIQGNDPTAIGSTGGGLGYQGIGKSVALKFDLRDTAGEGVNSTGLYLNGAAPTVPATTLAGTGIDLHSGHVFRLHLDYDGTTLSVSLTDTSTAAVYTTQIAADIPGTLGNNTGYFGFTASTGTAEADADTVKPLDTPASTATTANILDWNVVTAPSAATLTPTKLNFGNITVGSTSSVQIAKLINTGTEPITIASITASDPVASGGLPGQGGTNDPGIDVHSSFCAEAVTPTNYCKLEVTLAPGVAGPYTGNVVIKYYLGDGSILSENFTATLNITGTGVEPVLTVSPASLNFGQVTSLSAPVRTVTLTNSSDVPIRFGATTTSGDYGTIFGRAGGNCPEDSLAPGSSCSLGFSFEPRGAAQYSGTYTLNDTAGTQTITLTGSGTVIIPTFYPSNFNFGPVPVGGSVTMYAVTYNPTLSAAPVLGFDTTKLGLPNFELGNEDGSPPTFANACEQNTAIPSDGECDAAITFSPKDVGEFSGTVVLYVGTAQIPLTFTGTGTTSSRTITPTSLEFGTVPIGGTATRSITVTNTSATPITQFFAYENQGAANTIFVSTGGTCNDGPLAPGAFCTLAFRFSPQTATNYSGSYTLLNSPASQLLTVSGQGIPPTSTDFSVTTTTAALTVVRGSSAKLILDLDPSGTAPFTAPIAFSASGLPAGATATFSPSTLTPGTGSSTTMTVSVPALEARNQPPSPISPGSSTALGISAAALVAGLFGFRRRIHVRLLVFLCALGLLAAASGCGSGTGFTIPTTTSNLVVTATSGSITHTISVTLTVQ